MTGLKSRHTRETTLKNALPPLYTLSYAKGSLSRYSNKEDLKHNFYTLNNLKLFPLISKWPLKHLQQVSYPQILLKRAHMFSIMEKDIQEMTQPVKKNTAHLLTKLKLFIVHQSY